MNFLSGFYRVPLILAMPLLLNACVSAKIDPPTPERQSLLVLPVTLEMRAQYGRHGFLYIYKITANDSSVAPIRVVFKLPIKDEMLIVDSLPPGDYRVSEFSFKPRGTGDFTYGNNVQSRNDRFRLERGKITIFDKSLNVLVYNRTVGRGMSSTYEFDIEAVTPTQRQALLAKLASLPNFEQWQISDGKVRMTRSKSDPPNALITGMRGGWSGSWQPQAEATGDGAACSSGKIKFDIDGFRIRGVSESSYGEIFTLSASLNNKGIARGKVSQERVAVGKFRGGVSSSGDEMIGVIEFFNGCNASWSATSNVPRSDNDQAVDVAGKIDLSGDYRSSITSNHYFAFKNRESRSMVLSLRQDGDLLTAIDKAKTGVFNLRRSRDRISFVYSSAGIGYDIVGEWKLLDGGDRLQGSWKMPAYDAAGEWNLRRID